MEEHKDFFIDPNGFHVLLGERVAVVYPRCSHSGKGKSAYYCGVVTSISEMCRPFSGSDCHIEVEYDTFNKTTNTFDSKRKTRIANHNKRVYKIIQ